MLTAGERLCKCACGVGASAPSGAVITNGVDAGYYSNKVPALRTIGILQAAGCRPGGLS